jgi:hypothetical protein
MFKNSIVLTVLASALLVASRAQTAAPLPPSTGNNNPIEVVLADGTPVKLRMGSTAASDGARVGESLELEVAEDVRVADVVVIARGNVAVCEVTRLHAGVGNVGRYDISLRSVMLSDDEIVPVRSAKNLPTHPDQAMIISSASQDASIAPDTTVIAYIDGSHTLDVTRLRAAGGATQALKITSTPPNADVSVDGRLTGSTPYIFHLPAGDHTVSVRMAGYQPARRTVHLAAEPLAAEPLVLDVPLSRQDGSEAVPAPKSAEPPLGDLARAARARKTQQNSRPGSGAQAAPRDPMVRRVENQ